MFGNLLGAFNGKMKQYSNVLLSWRVNINTDQSSC